MRNNIEFSSDSQIPKASEEAIIKFETKIGRRLPEDYRQYLLQYNGNLPSKRDYCMPGESNWIETVHEMYGIFPNDHPLSILKFIDGGDGIPDGWLPIASSGYGDYTVISLLDQDFGCIYYLFHEVRGYDPLEREHGVYKLASSFSNWIRHLDDLSDNY